MRNINYHSFIHVLGRMTALQRVKLSLGPVTLTVTGSSVVTVRLMSHQLMVASRATPYKNKSNKLLFLFQLQQKSKMTIFLWKQQLERNSFDVQNVYNLIKLKFQFSSSRRLINVN